MRLRFPWADGDHWKVGWFESNTDHAGSVRGIHIRAESERLIEDRYIVITPARSHQTIRFSRSPSPALVETESLFLAALGAQQVQPDISENRAWADQLIASVELHSLKALESSPEQWAVRAAEIEAFLVAKLSVEPTAVEPFFHLGGLASLFARHGQRTKNPSWSQNADALLQSVIRYARDVSPQDERITQLERIRGELIAPGDQVAPRRLPASPKLPPSTMTPER